MTAELEDHSTPLRTITFIESHTGSEYRFLGARVLENGDLLIEGQDIGSTAEELYGEREFEYEVRVAAEHVPAVLLWLLKERFATQALTSQGFSLQGFTSTVDLRRWLDEHHIPSQFATY